MKRALDTGKSAESSSSARSYQAKRPKSSQACSSCRKHKTRCELLDSPAEGPYRCHRCKVLNIACSFESSDFAPPLQHTSPSPPVTLPARSAYISEPARISPPNISINVTTAGSDKDPTRSIKIEDLFPQPPKPWGFVKVPGGFDWTATPMLAMQNATTNRSQMDEDQSINEANSSLGRILSPDTVISLLNIFESIYCPWLNLQSGQASNHPVLTLAHCLVASRHLDAVTRVSVVPQLQKLTEEAVFRHIFKPNPSMESIQALLILSLWSPVAGPAKVEVRDGRLLTASAVSMAMNLRLSQAVAYVGELREDMKKHNDASDAITSDLEDAMEKARLWLSLMNAESMLCIGTGRVPLSHRTNLDLSVIDFSSSATVSSGRDTRLALMGQIFDITEGGLRLHLPSKSAIDTFYKEVVSVLMKLDNILRLISPLPVIIEHETFYFHALRVYHHTCRLLFLHHCLHETRLVVAGGSEQTSGSERPWYLFAEFNGVNIASHWGQEAVMLAEDILYSSISRPEVKQLGAAPDIFFAMLCFAASFIVMAKIAVHQSHGEILQGCSDALLMKITDRLLQSACSPDHAPARCAQLIKGLVANFEARTLKCSGEIERPGAQAFPRNTSSERASTANHESGSAVFVADGQQHFDASLPNYGSGGDFSRLMNSDVMLDSDFWASFMDNLTTDVPYIEGVRS